jgi:uncharacterized integral membrane protein
MTERHVNHESPVLWPEDRAELRLSYEDALSNIRWAKQQQWQVGYYILLVYVAIIGYAELAEVRPSGMSWRESAPAVILISLSVLVALVGARFLCSYQAFMMQERTRLHRIRDRHFCNAFHETIFNKPDHLNFWHHGDLLIAFIVAAIVGSDFVIWRLSIDFDLLILATLAMPILAAWICIGHSDKPSEKWSRP